MIKNTCALARSPLTFVKCRIMYSLVSDFHYIKGRDYVESSADVTSKLAHYLGQFVFFLYTKNHNFQHTKHLRQFLDHRKNNQCL